MEEKRLIDYLDQNYQRHLAELMDFIKFKSVSSVEEYRQETLDCASYLLNMMENIGLKSTQLLQTQKFPVVYGEWIRDSSKPTILIYGHYDVQPAEPLEFWDNPPFEPKVQNDCLYARGASDNKGQIFMHLKVIEAYLKTFGQFPVNVKVIIEGEEEIGSPHFHEVLTHYKELLSCDLVFISDTATIGLDQPAICYGLRGILSFELKVHGPSIDLPSGGFYGGNIRNPIHALAEIISSMHRQNGQVNVERFYSGVSQISEEEKQHFERLNFSEQKLIEQTTARELFGESGFSVLERAWTRPTMEVNQIWSGHYGEGHKAIIPSVACANISCRLVPEQDPEKIWEKITTHIHQISTPGVVVEANLIEASKPYCIDYRHPWLESCADALQRYFETPTSFIRAGGSIPVVETLSAVYGVPILLVGFGLPDGNVHGPNEHFSLSHFRKGMKALCYYWFNFDNWRE